jgi:hypothetical protein
MRALAWVKRAWTGAEGVHTAVWLYGVTGFAAVMAYLAYITDWVSSYGPVGWGAIGVVTFLVLAFALYLYGRYQVEAAAAEFTRRKGEAAGANVLSPVHENERINLVDFYHPFYRATENARFENCDLMGPAWVAIDGCNFLHDLFSECELVIVRSDRPIKGASRFRFCTFVRSRFYRVTFIVNHEQFQTFPQEFRAGIPVISDGRVGDL